MKPHSKRDETQYYEYLYKSRLEKALHTLEGILKGIAIDGKINQHEITELNSWCSEYREFSNRSPFNQIVPIIKESITTKALTPDDVADILWLCDYSTTTNQYFDIITVDMQRLHGILHGILADNQIEIEEIKELNRWISENTHLAGVYPYDEIESILNQVLQDGQIDQSEHDLLKVFFSEFIAVPANSCIDQQELSHLKKFITIPGICTVNPKIKIKLQQFCFTGLFAQGERDEIAKIITEHGGIYVDTVKPELNYLIVGSFTNPCWAFSCYGRKITQAIAYRKKGSKLLIINENDFWEALQQV